MPWGGARRARRGRGRGRRARHGRRSSPPARAEVRADRNLALEPRDTLTFEARRGGGGAGRGRRWPPTPCGSTARSCAPPRWPARSSRSCAAVGALRRRAQAVRPRPSAPSRPSSTSSPSSPATWRRRASRPSSAFRARRARRRRRSRSPRPRSAAGEAAGIARRHRAPGARRHRLHLRALAALRDAPALVVARRVRQRERAGRPRSDATVAARGADALWPDLTSRKAS